MSISIQKYVNLVNLKSWSEFKAKVDSFMLEWIYRGQAKASWTLMSSFDRSPSLLELDPDIENLLIGEYQRAIRSFDDRPDIPTTTLDWLALLQHYRTPTRLIDFTRSPYVAAYFAFQEEHDDEEEPVAIWCVDRIAFYQAAVYYLKNKIEITKFLSHQHVFWSAAFEKLHSMPNVDCVMPFDLSSANQRQLNQQAVFLVAMNINKPFAEQLEFLDYQGSPVINKLTIPRSDREVALRDLMKMNITHATLFPGIDGFSRSLSLKYSTLATFGDTAKWHAQLEKDGFAT